MPEAAGPPLLPAAAAHLWLGIPGQARLLGSLPTLPTPSVVGQFGGFSAGFAFTCQVGWEAVQQMTPFQGEGVRSGGYAFPQGCG